jgi:hypothetical protein
MPLGRQKDRVLALAGGTGGRDAGGGGGGQFGGRLIPEPELGGVELVAQ